MKIGDRVSVISETIKGKILKIEGQQCVVEDEDGFERNYQLIELALISSADDYRIVDQDISEDIQSKIKDQQKQVKLKHYELDLHIEELVESHSNMTNHEILTKQMTTCRGFIQNAIATDQKRLVLIHGKGEGVLKSEIHLFLNKLRNYNGVSLEYHDASFTEYGMGGATEVIFY